MKKLLISVAVVCMTILATSCSSNSKSNNNQTEEQTEQTTNTTVADIVNNPDTYTDQQVTVTGTVKDICPCPKTEGKVICLQDGEICIPAENSTAWDSTIVGKSITVTGIVKKCSCCDDKPCQQDNNNKSCCNQDNKDNNKTCCKNKDNAQETNNKPCCKDNNTNNKDNNNANNNPTASNNNTTDNNTDNTTDNNNPQCCKMAKVFIQVKRSATAGNAQRAEANYSVGKRNAMQNTGGYSAITHAPGDAKRRTI